MAVFGLPGGMEWFIILAIVLLLFGPSQLPKLMKMFGKSAKQLREGLEGKDEDEEEKPAKAETVPKAEPKAEAVPDVPKAPATTDDEDSE